MSPEINKEARESIQEELSCLFFRTHAKEHADSTDTLWTSHTTPYWHHQEHVHGVCLPLAFQVGHFSTDYEVPYQLGRWWLYETVGTTTL
jgi:hypothetical protein